MLAATRDWWRTIWASPMAAVWLDADVPTLVRLAGLVDTINREGVTDDTRPLLGEIRALEDRFGLSPIARRRLQWEVDQAATATGDVQRARDAAAKVTDIRDRLRA